MLIGCTGMAVAGIDPGGAGGVMGGGIEGGGGGIDGAVPGNLGHLVFYTMQDALLKYLNCFT